MILISTRLLLLGATSDKEESDILNKKLSETCTYRGGKVVPPQLFYEC